MTFPEFWLQYLRAHSRPVTRAVHYVATILGVGSVILAAATLQPLLLLGVALAYGLAISAHAFVEKNQSMIRVNPIWGAIADLRMFWLAFTGGLGRELAKSGAPVSPSRRHVVNDAGSVKRA
jgi:hypothetical protein